MCLGEGHVYLGHGVQTIMAGLGLWSQILYVQFPGLLLSRFVTIVKLFNFTVP